MRISKKKISTIIVSDNDSLANLGVVVGRYTMAYAILDISMNKEITHRRKKIKIKTK